MSKILTAAEMADIISKEVKTGSLKDRTPEFVTKLAGLIGEFFGGDPSEADYLDDELGYTVSFRIDERVPADGGVFKDFDTDVTWKNGEEFQ